MWLRYKWNKYIKYFSSSPVLNVLYFGAQSNRWYRWLTAILRACALRIDLKWVYHPDCTKGQIKCIIRTVTEAYVSHRLLADLRRQNGMVNTAFLSFCILTFTYCSTNNYRTFVYKSYVAIIIIVINTKMSFALNVCCK